MFILSHVSLKACIICNMMIARLLIGSGIFQRFSSLHTVTSLERLFRVMVNQLVSYTYTCVRICRYMQYCLLLYSISLSLLCFGFSYYSSVPNFSKTFTHYYTILLSFYCLSDIDPTIHIVAEKLIHLVYTCLIDIIRSAS